jgi:hypothetical protein
LRAGAARSARLQALDDVSAPQRGAIKRLVLSLLNPLHVARLSLLTAVRTAQLGLTGAGAASTLMGEVAEEALTILRVRPPHEEFAAVHERNAPRWGDSAVFVSPWPSFAHREAAYTEGADMRPQPRARPTPRPPAPPSTAPRPAEAAAASPRPSPEAPAPRRVSEEETLVASLADPGAEDGAGAELSVQPPWRGYAKMRAVEIADRLPAESDAVLSLVLLYERRHRRRRSVRVAAERELTRRGGPARRARRA